MNNFFPGNRILPTSYRRVPIVIFLIPHANDVIMAATSVYQTYIMY